MNFDNLGESTEQEELEPMALDEGDMGDEFGFAGEGSGKRRIGETTIVIIAALLVAGGGLYGMRWLGSQAGATKTDGALEAKVEAFLQNLVGTGAQTERANYQEIDPSAIKGRLTDDRTKKQVPLEEVKQNPFLRLEKRAAESAAEAALAEIDTFDPAELERQRLQRLQLRLAEAASNLWVTSIVGRKGRRLAQIEFASEKLHVTVGDEVAVDAETVFIVTRIESFSVHLAAEGFDFTITMGE